VAAFASEWVAAFTSEWVAGFVGIRRSPLFTSFFWQAGFGAFSVSQSQVEEVRAYIRNQREHHRVKTFQEELRAFLKAYEMTNATCGIERSRGLSGRRAAGTC